MRNLKFRAWDNLQKKYLWPYPNGFNVLGEVTCFNLIEQQCSEFNPDKLTSLERATKQAPYT